MEGSKTYQKWRDAAKYLMIACQQFPKSEKYALGMIFRQAIVACGTYLGQANAPQTGSSRKRRLENADYQIQSLKTMVQLAFDLRYIDMKKYELSSAYLLELGRMVGGWIGSMT